MACHRVVRGHTPAWRRGRRRFSPVNAIGERTQTRRLPPGLPPPRRSAGVCTEHPHRRGRSTRGGGGVRVRAAVEEVCHRSLPSVWLRPRRTRRGRGVPGVRGERMRRWTVKLALCLLAGAVVTWAAAWGCALWGPLKERGGTATKISGDVLAEMVEAPPAAQGWQREVEALESVGPGLSVAAFVLGDSWDTGDFGHFQIQGWIVDTRAGFPRLALGCRRVSGSTTRVQHGIEAPQFFKPASPFRGWGRPGLAPSRDLPLRPLPLGFALNTLLYAAVLLGLVECLALTRRQVRRAKGRCPSCAYDRAGLTNNAPCPECGAG
jgi:hypothetical protein